MPATSVVTAATWFKDVHVFDSRTGTRGDTSQVLVKDGLIASVTTGDRAPDGSDGASVIDGAGKTLIPGLIDAHYHAALASISKK